MTARSLSPPACSRANVWSPAINTGWSRALTCACKGQPLRPRHWRSGPRHEHFGAVRPAADRYLAADGWDLAAGRQPGDDGRFRGTAAGIPVCADSWHDADDVDQRARHDPGHAAV